jgi:DNA-binding transcriptional ArsR family regulator
MSKSTLQIVESMKDSDRKSIAQALIEFNRPCKSEHIAAHLGLDPNSVSAQMSWLKMKGIVTSARLNGTSLKHEYSITSNTPYKPHVRKRATQKRGSRRSLLGVINIRIAELSRQIARDTKELNALAVAHKAITCGSKKP